MDEKRLFIEQKAKETDLYTVLQKDTLEKIQQLSGEIWNDFNTHDPGVTVADVSNYALTELNYKLGFNLQDYLTTPEGNFVPEEYGLFLPEDVYPTTPVTIEDYRKLLLAEIPELENVELIAYRISDKAGAEEAYDIRLYLDPFCEPSEEIRQRVLDCFHENRNLCENLNSILFCTPTTLRLFAELELQPGEEPTSMLAQLYWNIMQYLSGSIRIKKLDKHYRSNLSIEEWMDGSGRDMSVIIPQQENTERELYAQLVQIEGIQSIKACYLVNKPIQETSNIREGDIISTFDQGAYSLLIPKKRDELKVSIYMGKVKMQIDLDRFVAELQALYFSKKTYRLGQIPKKENPEDLLGKIRKETYFSRTLMPSAVYRKVYNHREIWKDLPECYRIKMGKSKSKDGKIPGSFEAYLSLFDRLICRGLSELEQQKALFSISPNSEKNCRNKDKLKNRYLDFLDHLYGVNSNPSWMRELSSYGETEEEMTKRRMEYLCYVPYLTCNRSRSRNIYGKLSEWNIPVIKLHLSLLLGLNRDESISVGNILPSHNLILMGNEKENKKFRDRINSKLISEKMLNADTIENIPLEEPKLKGKTLQEEFLQIRHRLMMFNTNLISGGIFRQGIKIENYKLVHLSGDEVLLVFWNEEDECWINMGRSDERFIEEKTEDGASDLKFCANILCAFFKKLNRLCETVYVLEHHLFANKSSFALSFVLPGWTARFSSPRFKNIFRQLIGELLPAHITYDIYWLDVEHMQYFEEYYQNWCRAVVEGYPKEEIEALQTAMILELEEVQKEKNKE